MGWQAGSQGVEAKKRTERQEDVLAIIHQNSIGVGNFRRPSREELSQYQTLNYHLSSYIGDSESNESCDDS